MSIWIGRILSALVVILLLADAATNLFAPDFIRTEMEATGFPVNLAPVLGMIIAICAILYAVPKTAFLGAILVTAFLGGAICTHFRLGEFFTPPQIVSLLLGAATWGGLYLRDQRLRQLIPLNIV
ncbi:DoxX family protein [Rhizobium sp. BK379]|uniref:DoxX family protein n=1 Tax=Rhizobium sp. BK379 TaxID=2587059 RepID=UPI001617A599|nr:DoxX family protein [Rhizobium sp. BK379]MBB3443644.1 putative membrane protein [Rhizobium sp. BK379]